MKNRWLRNTSSFLWGCYSPLKYCLQKVNQLRDEKKIIKNENSHSIIRSLSHFWEFSKPSFFAFKRPASTPLYFLGDPIALLPLRILYNQVYRLLKLFYSLLWKSFENCWFSECSPDPLFCCFWLLALLMPLSRWVYETL